MADETFRKDRDMILAPNEFMFVRDDTKGNVDVFVGPTKQSLGGQDQPVRFDPRSKRFVEADYNVARQLKSIAPEGWYAVLKNPARDGATPNSSGKLSTPPLEVGKKVVIPGPASFCLWPGQMAKILQGHHMRSNQYLIARVYDEAAARASWQHAVVKPASGAGEGFEDSKERDQLAQALSMGQLLVIKGTDVAFFIPPTGLEVVPDENGELVREAVTLEALEYCLLIDENGNKRYEQGPAVVFPEPTEVFVTEGEGEDRVRKYRAIDLNENTGLYVKVIAEYEEGGVKHPVGEELFITGKQQMIYYPRPEHALLKYGDSEKHFAIAIPAGEARYVLDRNTGIVELVKGPQMYLPDPRTHVVVRRVLDQKLVGLLYPGNAEALFHNQKLQQAGREGPIGPQGALGAAGAYAGMTGTTTMDWGGNAILEASANMVLGDSPMLRGLTPKKAGTKHAGDAIDRKGSYTEPRTITLSTKYQGAVTVAVYTGYAMKLVRATGESRVVVGPARVLLEYDEVPEVMELSTGKPKTTDKLLATPYLRVKTNKVADEIRVETADYCAVNIKVSYCVDFEGDPKQWFNAENYVKLLCDRMRSRLKELVRTLPLGRFYAASTNYVRDAVLGVSRVDLDERVGTQFKENGMLVYDVEVLGVTVADQAIAQLMTKAQQEAVRLSIEVEGLESRVVATRDLEEGKRRLAQMEAETVLALHTRQIEKSKSELSVGLAGAEVAKASAVAQNAVAEIARARKAADFEQEMDERTKRATQELRVIEAETRALVEKAGAVGPDLIAALSAFSDKALVAQVAESMAPMAIIGGKSVLDVVKGLLAGSPIAKHLDALPAAKNGQSASA